MDIVDELLEISRNDSSDPIDKAIGEIARLRDESARLRADAARLDWLERETHKSSYAVQFRLLRDPEINAGMNRIECTTTVGGGPWQRDVEGATLRAAIDAAMQKGE